MTGAAQVRLVLLAGDLEGATGDLVQAAGRHDFELVLDVLAQLAAAVAAAEIAVRGW